MPIYHSSFNDVKGTPTCGTAILPLKTKVKGPAPITTEKDIIDESIEFYRANVLHRNYKILGAADMIIIYLTVYISELLREFSRYKTKSDAKSALVSNAVSMNFSLPGNPNFVFNNYFAKPDNNEQQELFRTYFRQLREETYNRLLDVVYSAPNDTASKWWMMFSKRKFMNISKAT